MRNANAPRGVLWIRRFRFNVRGGVIWAQALGLWFEIHPHSLGSHELDFRFRRFPKPQG
jgi:hypothetical protein